MYPGAMADTQEASEDGRRDPQELKKSDNALKTPPPIGIIHCLTGFFTNLAHGSSQLGTGQAYFAQLGFHFINIVDGIIQTTAQSLPINIVHHATPVESTPVLTQCGSYW